MANVENRSGWLPPKEPIAKASYLKVTSIVILTFRHVVVVTGNLDTHRLAYTAAQAHTSAMGWWGIPFGLFLTPHALFKNTETFNAVKTQLGDGKFGAGWYRDPSGKFQERLWDGAVWTELVRNTVAESLLEALYEVPQAEALTDEPKVILEQSAGKSRRTQTDWLDNFCCPRCGSDVYLDLAARSDDFLWTCPSCQVKSGKSRWLANRLK